MFGPYTTPIERNSAQLACDSADLRSAREFLILNNFPAPDYIVLCSGAMEQNLKEQCGRDSFGSSLAFGSDPRVYERVEWQQSVDENKQPHSAIFSIGTINQKPVCLELNYHKIDNKIFLLYRPVSPTVDWEMVLDFMTSIFPNNTAQLTSHTSNFVETNDYNQMPLLSRAGGREYISKLIEAEESAWGVTGEASVELDDAQEASSPINLSVGQVADLLSEMTLVVQASALERAGLRDRFEAVARDLELNKILDWKESDVPLALIIGEEAGNSQKISGTIALVGGMPMLFIDLTSNDQFDGGLLANWINEKIPKAMVNRWGTVLPNDFSSQYFGMLIQAARSNRIPNPLLPPIPNVEHFMLATSVKVPCATSLEASSSFTTLEEREDRTKLHGVCNKLLERLQAASSQDLTLGQRSENLIAELELAHSLNLKVDQDKLSRVVDMAKMLRARAHSDHAVEIFGLNNSGKPDYPTQIKLLADAAGLMQRSGNLDSACEALDYATELLGLLFESEDDESLQGIQVRSSACALVSKIASIWLDLGNSHSAQAVVGLLAEHVYSDQPEDPMRREALVDAYCVLGRRLETPKSIDMFEQAWKIALNSSNPFTNITSIIGTLLDLSRTEEAERFYARALELPEFTDTDVVDYMSLILRARLHCLLGKNEMALRTLNVAHRFADEVDGPAAEIGNLRPQALCDVAIAAAECNFPDLAIDILELVQEQVGHSGDAVNLPQVYRAITNSAIRSGDLTLATSLATQHSQNNIILPRAPGYYVLEAQVKEKDWTGVVRTAGRLASDVRYDFLAEIVSGTIQIGAYEAAAENLELVLDHAKWTKNLELQYKQLASFTRKTLIELGDNKI